MTTANATEVPDSVLNRVSKLIERASHAKTPETERDACLAKADALMLKYAIDAAMLDTSQNDKQAEEPISKTIAFPPNTSPWTLEFRQIIHQVCENARVKVATRSWNSDAILVGFPSDVEYAQMLWLSIYYAFVSKIDPKWDPSRTRDENVKALKEAGIPWSTIALYANSNGWTDVTANDGKLKAAYRRQCKLEGVEPTPHTQRNAAYRKSYASSFAHTIVKRLRSIAKATKDEATKAETATPGTALALRDRGAHVDAKFYDMFPELRPPTEAERAKWREEANRAAAEEEAKLAKMTERQREEYWRKKAREEERDRKRWFRERAAMDDGAGSMAGYYAAQTVDLSAGRNNISTDRKELK